MVSALAAGMIAGYQRYLSPHKGFCCAHRALHGGPSCSEFARRVVRRRGVGPLAPLLRRRFARCAAAARRLRAARAANAMHQAAAGPPRPLDYAGPATGATEERATGGWGDGWGSAALECGSEAAGMVALEACCSCVPELIC